MKYRIAIGFVTLLVVVSVFASCTATTQIETYIPTNTPQDLPLSVGNTWVYQRTSYAGFNASDIMTVTSTITETVITISQEGQYAVATFRRDESAEQLISEDNNAFTSKNAFTSHNFWLVVDGDTIYHQDFAPDLSRIEGTGELSLVFPLEVGEKWYLNYAMAEQNPDRVIDSSLRKVQSKKGIDLPAGHFEGCFLMSEIIGGSIFERWFCPGIGWVDQKSDHSGTPYGWREVLVEYHLH